MSYIKKWKGFLLCLAIAIPCWFLGELLPVVGGPVFGILTGMFITLFLKDKTHLQEGIMFTSKKILQYAVILLGFSTVTGESFEIFTGTAINDTSSVTAAAATWDSLYELGSTTLDKAVTVKLT